MCIVSTSSHTQQKEKKLNLSKLACLLQVCLLRQRAAISNAGLLERREGDGREVEGQGGREREAGEREHALPLGLMTSPSIKRRLDQQGNTTPSFAREPATSEKG